MTIKLPKKLIEVALPLDDINIAAAREKSIRHGHPSTLHLWWARRPLAAARAVIFAQMVNDPGYERELGRGMNKHDAQQERERLFEIIRRLVLWENTNNEAVLEEARAEIWKSWRETCELNKNHPQAAELFNPEKLPAFHDPFAGGGALPLEAQRLGLESYASDLNPVAVLINKAMIEIPPQFAGRAPVGAIPDHQKQINIHEDWSGAKGLAEDVRRYGYWMREEAFKRIGHLYPQVDLKTGLPVRPELVEGSGSTSSPRTANTATIIAWLWARTVKSPNPAFSHVDVPLISTFILSSKAGKEAYIEPIIEGDSYRFEVRHGKPPASAKAGTKAIGRGANFLCLLSGTPISGDYIKAEGNAGRIGARLIAVVAEGKSRRTYLVPTAEMEAIAKQAKPDWQPSGDVPARLTGGTCVPYGLKKWGNLFTTRQLVALTTFSDLVQEARDKVLADAIAHGMADDGLSLADGGKGAAAYADAMAVYFGMALNKVSDRCSSICGWDSSRDSIRNTFGRQAIPMVWDFAESNTLSESSGSWLNAFDQTAKAILTFPSNGIGTVKQNDAQTQSISPNKVISTDPPYCLIAGTLIQTRYGYQPIESLNIGDEVLTHTGRFAKITHTYKRFYRGAMQQLTVAHNNQPLQITPEHPIQGIQTAACGYQMDYCRHDCSYLAQQGTCRHQAFADYKLNWIKAAEVKRHDLIFLPRYHSNEKYQSHLSLNAWLPAGDYVELNGKLHYQKVTERSLQRREPLSRQYHLPARVEINAELCRLVGYFAAEGYAYLRSDGGTINFVFHQDEIELHNDVRQSMAACFGLVSGLDTVPENNKSLRLNFYSKPLAHIFRTWCYNAAGFKQLPDWIIDLPDNLLSECLKGYWLGDGCRRSNVYEASTNSAALAGQLRLILQRFQVVSRLHINDKKSQYKSVVNGATIQSTGSQYQIIVSGHTLPKLAAIVGQPKRNSLGKKLRKSHGHEWQGGYLLPIRQVETVDFTGWVYNLETEDHSYVTSAGCVHNCDNIGYADLSDFFYVWLRRALRPVYPELFATLAVPKAEELVATPYRHGGKANAEKFFLDGMTCAMHRLAEQAHPAFPVTIYYAYKQSNTSDSGETVSMGWETFLEAVMQAGFAITGTLPMRTELANRMIGSGTNALASSIVLVCRKRAENAPTISRRQFLRDLKQEMTEAMEVMMGGAEGISPVAPVDLAQAIIGPGMAIYSKYSAVLEADGSAMNVHTALTLINKMLIEGDDDFDADTQFCLSWFDEVGWSEGEFGKADVLTRAKGTSVQKVRDAGVVESSAGRVRLLKWTEYAKDWLPTKNDHDTPIWEALHQLIREFNQNGEIATGALLAKMPSRAEAMRSLAYRLYTLCERKNWAEDARSYNELITAWTSIESASHDVGHVGTQMTLDF